MRNFDSTDEKDDLVLDVYGEKLHCDSQILSWNSKIFRAMIKESEGSSEICLKDSIPVEDLRELLHYLYSSCEPVNDHNFRELLHWGHTFEVNYIVRLCHQYMESLVLSRRITKALRIEFFLLSWKYSVEHLKNIYASREVYVGPPNCMKKIVENVGIPG
ncbi:unnamed protein product [Auanema sp. JU1783]|nr:unnamed protein product [Auanema sp. JU1783]